MSLNTLASSLIEKVFDNTLPGGATVAASATYRVRSNPTFDPSTGSRSPDETDITISLIPKNKSYYIQDGVGRETLSFIAKPFSGVDLENVTKDVLVVDSQSYRVISVDRVQMGSTDLVFKIRVGGMSIDSRRSV